MAQVGAVIGRDFSRELLAAVVPLQEHELLAALDRLAATELISRQEVPSGTSYAFKHALVREAAYGTLLRRERRELHARIARALEERFGELAATEPERLAQHYQAAELAEPAVRCWLAAGQRAHQQSANTEAAIHLRQGIELLERLPEDPARAGLELGLQATLGLVLSATQGYAHPEVERAYSRAHELCGQLGDAPAILPVLINLAAFHVIRNKLGRAREVASQVLQLAEVAGQPEQLMVANAIFGAVLWFRGEYAAAGRHLETALAFYDRRRDAPLATIYGQNMGRSSGWAAATSPCHRQGPTGSQVDPFTWINMGVIALSYSALLRLCLGFPDQALRTAGEAVASASEAKSPFHPLPRA